MSTSKPNHAYLSGFEKSLMMEKATSEEEAKAVTSVFWDINMFPIPSGFDPRRVRPCIKQVLKDYGYSGPLTFTAVGVLKDVPSDVLRGVCSSGIALINIRCGRIEMGDHISEFTRMNKAPANVISISEPNPSLLFYLQSRGYNILQPFPCEDTFQSFLLAADSGAPEEETTDSAYWDCLVCRRDPPGRGFETLASHLSSEEHEQLTLECLSCNNVLPPLPRDIPPVLFKHSVSNQPMNEYIASMTPAHRPRTDKAAVTSVFWDINACPLPCEFDDPCLVGPRIKRYWKQLGYSGPLTITAVGRLTEVPHDVLQAVSSSGIVLHHVPRGSSDILALVFESTISKPPPANILVISNPDPASGLKDILTADFVQPWGYNLLIEPCLEDILSVVSLEEDKCSEPGEWICSVCFRGKAFQGFENFTMHLSSRAHGRKMLDCLPWDARFSHPEDARFSPSLMARQSRAKLQANEDVEKEKEKGKGKEKEKEEKSTLG